MPRCELRLCRADSLYHLFGYRVVDHVTRIGHEPQCAVRKLVTEPDGMPPVIDNPVLRSRHDRHRHVQLPIAVLQRRRC